MSTTPYPEHDKQRAVLQEAGAIGEFLDWLGSKGIFLASHVEIEGYSSPQLQVIYTQPEQLLAEHFGIDLTKIEREKRAMIELMRKVH